jgi:hypothetical protein
MEMDPNTCSTQLYILYYYVHYYVSSNVGSSTQLCTYVCSCSKMSVVLRYTCKMDKE